MATAEMMTPISELPQSPDQAMPMQLAQAMPSSLAQATQGQVAQPQASTPQVENLPELPRIPTFEQDAQQQPQRQPLSTEVLPAAKPMPKPDFGMKLIAAIAMGKGNFGPAFEIKQMERKGAAYAEYLESRKEFNYLMSRGDDKKAAELLRESSIRMLQSAPELKELVTADTDRLYKKQDTSAQVQGLIALAKLRQKRDGVDNQGFIDIMEASGPFAHNPEALQRLLTAAGYSFAPSPSQNKTIRHNAQMGTTEEIQLGYSFSEQNLKGPVGDLIVAATRFQPNEIANAMNDKSVMRDNADVGPALKKVVADILAMGRGIEAQIELVKLAPFTPEQTQALKQSYVEQGMSEPIANLMTATRGAVPKEFLTLVNAASGQLAGAGVNAGEQARQIVAEERNRLLRYAIGVKGDVKLPLVPEISQQIAVVDKSEGKYGTEVVNISYNEAIANPDRYGVPQRKIFETKIQPIAITIQDLSAVKDMFAYAGHPSGMVGRFSSGAQQLIARYLGSSDSRDAKLQVARFLFNRAIEEVKNTANIPDAEVGRLKAIAAGPMADEKAGIAATNDIIKRMKDTLNIYMNESSLSVNTEPIKPKQTTSAPSMETINKAAGVPSKGGKKQASNDNVLVVGEAVANTIEGMSDINSPIEQSTNYQANSGQVIGNNSVSGLQVAQVIVSTRMRELQNKGAKAADLQKYVILNSDSKEVVISKLKESAALMGGSTTTKVPTPVATPPIGTGPITLNPGIVHIPRKK